MKCHTATELKNEIGKVLNAVQKDGAVVIKSKSRPEMVLMERDVYEELKAKKES